MPVTTCIFDAYGTLFDVDAAARQAAGAPGRDGLAERWPALSGHWRRKQLEYSWQCAIRGLHRDFWQLTCDALDWAMEAEGLADPELREDLLAAYWQLAAYREVPRLLATLKARGLATGILSNGSPDMLEGAVEAAGIGGWIDAVLSVESAGTFKPDRRVYDLVGQHFDTTPDQVLFVSANGWDVTAAAEYGFATAWINRAGQPADRLPAQPCHVLADLASLADLTELDLS